MLGRVLRLQHVWGRMAKTGKESGRGAQQGARGQRANTAVPEVVELGWLLRAGALVLALGLVCAYITVCGLFVHGEWQLVLHPVRAAAHSPAEYGLKAEDVRFGTGDELHGWWIAGGSAAEPTVMMLPSGDGSAGDWLARAGTLHEAGVDVLLFDYRGYGASGGRHPDEASMETDSESGLAYLTGARGVPAGSVVVFGAGAGASLAVRLCGEHPEVPAMILEAADGDFGERAKIDARASIVPFGILFHETFPFADRLHTLKTPKLLISYTTGAPPEVIARASDPKTMLEIPGAAASKDVIEGVRRFLGSYVATGPGVLLPNR